MTTDLAALGTQTTTKMNSIIIHPDNTRTVIGELAHEVAYSSMWQDIAKHCLETFFAVIEVNEGGKWTLRANQSTLAGANRYMARGRVLVHHQ